MKLKIILIILSGLLLTLSLSGGIYHYRTARSGAIQQNHNLLSRKVAKTALDIDSILTVKQQAISRLATLEPLEKLLQESTAESIRKAYEALDSFNSAFQDSIIYLMDTTGKTIVSSNRNRPDSFVGNNYGFRPYFQEAVLGKPSQFVGIGVTSKKAGIYLSHPVYDHNSKQVIGVAVGKFPFDDILRIIKHSFPDGISTITGPGSIIFLSANEDLVGKFLWEPSPEIRQETAASRQFGEGPWPWSGIRKIAATRAVDNEKRNLTIHRDYLKSLPGWNLTFLHNDTIFVEKLSTTLIQTIGITFSIILLIIGLLVIFLYLMADREIKGRKLAEDKLVENQKNLEVIVQKRTLELQISNKNLRNEIAEHNKDILKLEYSTKTQQIITRVLSLSHDFLSLEEFLDEFLKYASSFSEFGLLPQSALFMVKDDHPEVLELQAHYHLNNRLQDICTQVPFGRCLCGQAAETRKIVFANCLDERHENTFKGIQPHGHYCVPISAKTGDLLGVYTVYTENYIAYDQRLAKLLGDIASILANTIEYKKVALLSQENHQKYRAITNTATDSIIMVNHHSLITFWNPAAENLFGYTKDEALGKNIHNLIAPKSSRNKAHAAFNQFTKAGTGPIVGKMFEMVALNKSGEEFPVELSISSVRRGKHWAAIGILRDITARKNLEAEKMEMAHQLQQAQKMEALGTLAGGIAHDFNNILSSILGYASLIQDEMQPDCTESMEDIAQVIKAGNRAKDLVRQILTFSRQTEEEILPVQVSLVIKEALKMLRGSLPSNIEIIQLISSGASTVLSDPTHINQLIMNLCTNSYKAMREDGGTLTVRLNNFSPDEAFAQKHPDLQNNQFLCLTVTDTGQGMTPSIIPRIFDPYFSTNKKEDGTGLGLAVVHGIVTKLNGIIDVSSELGVGTTFKIFLPVAKDLIEEKKPPATVVEMRGSENILIIDDELPILQLQERIISKLGYKTVCRTSSIEALELFRNQPDRFDLIVTDHIMPNMTGAKMAEAMVEIRPGMPIILCTGYSELNLPKQTKDKYIRQILMKPVNRNELAQSIREVLDQEKDK